MKKTIAILLVAILAVSSVFAAFSGEAKLGFGGNFDSGEWGFIDKSANVNFNIDLATATAEQIADGDVYASIKATFGLKLMTGEKKYAEGDPYNGLMYLGRMYGDKAFAIGIIADITEAKVAGENWSVSILGLSDAPNFAESAIDTYTVENGRDKYGLPRDDFDKAYNYGVAFEKANGVEVNVFDYVFGLGIVGEYDDADTWKFDEHLALSLYAKTPEYNFNGIVAQLGGVYSYLGTETATKNAIGVSAKAGYVTDVLTATVAADMGFDLEADGKDVFDMDLAANFGWNFLTLDAYYATEAVSGETPVNPVGGNVGDSSDWDKTTKDYTKNVLSAQVKFDLNAFDVPVAITASAKDLLHKVDLGVKAEVTPIEGLKLTANAGYVVDTIDAYNKADYLDPNGMSGLTDKQLNDNFKETYKGVFLGQWKFGLDAEYDFGFAKVAAGVSLKNVGFKEVNTNYDMYSGSSTVFSDEFVKDANKNVEAVMKGEKEVKDAYNAMVNKVVLGMSASVSTTSIIPGAELKLAWENADDLLSLYKYNADAEKYNFGKITASCKIAF